MTGCALKEQLGAKANLSALNLMTKVFSHCDTVILRNRAKDSA